MKIWSSAFVFLSLVSLFAACDDHDQWLPGNIPGKGEAALYSNKLSAPVGGNILVLTYNGSELIGKDAVLSVDREGNPSLVLRGILPGEPETPLTGFFFNRDGEALVFEGEAVGQLGTTFAYCGSVEQGKMSLDLKEIRIPSNFLADAGTWTVVKTGSEPMVDSVSGGRTFMTIPTTGYAGGILLGGADMGALVGMIAGNLVNSVLKEVSFQPDGRITAVYADFPEQEDLMNNLLGTGVARTEEEWKDSPDKNLASYYMADDTTLYIVPNVDMIIREIGNGKTRAGEDELAESLREVYKLLNRWTTQGIKSIAKALPEDGYVKGEGDVFQRFEGDVSIAVTARELQPVIDLLHHLPDSVLEKEVELMGIPMKIGDLLSMIEITPDFSVWIYFNRAQPHAVN